MDVDSLVIRIQISPVPSSVRSNSGIDTDTCTGENGDITRFDKVYETLFGLFDIPEGGGCRRVVEDGQRNTRDGQSHVTVAGRDSAISSAALQPFPTHHHEPHSTTWHLSDTRFCSLLYCLVTVSQQSHRTSFICQLWSRRKRALASCIHSPWSCRS